MEIRAKQVRIEGSSTSKNETAWLDSATILAGYAASVRVYPEYNVVLVVRDIDGRTYLTSLPSKEWKEDLKDDGYEILFEVKK